jgi:type IV pilus assembly protein PilW
MKKLKQQMGISLVEILVSLVISIFLLGGIIQVYLANKASYSFTNALSRVQENGRFSVDTMARDLRMAGFFGCAIFDPDDTSSIVNNLNPAGTGYADSFDWLGDGLISGIDNDPDPLSINGSDSITIRGAKPGQLNVLPPYNTNASANLHVTPNSTIVPGDIVMVTNCKGADIFQVTNTTPATTSAKNSIVHNTGSGHNPGNFNPGNCTGANAHCLSQSYGSDASMIELQVVTYMIQAGASGEPALFRSENGVNDELIDGIEQMQILYGVDTSDDDYPNRYFTATNVPDMNEVIAVRLMLLVRSESDFITEENQNYTFNSAATQQAPDRRLRQVFSTTIALRNRVGP